MFEPDGGNLQFFVELFIFIIRLTEKVIESAEHPRIVLRLHQNINSTRECLTSLFQLFQVVIDDTHLLVGHRPSDVIVTFLCVNLHTLCFTKGGLHLSHIVKCRTLSLPRLVETVPDALFLKPLHLYLGLFLQLFETRGVVQNRDTTPTGITFFLDTVLLLTEYDKVIQTQERTVDLAGIIQCHIQIDIGPCFIFSFQCRNDFPQRISDHACCR